MPNAQWSGRTRPAAPKIITNYFVVSAHTAPSSTRYLETSVSFSVIVHACGPQWNFKPLFCRQIVWAIIEDGRSYFATRMSPDDFIGLHPDEIHFPTSTLNEIEPNIRHQTPIIRSSFPPQWCIGLDSRLPPDGSAQSAPLQSLLPPVASISATHTLPTPSVFSAISAGSISAAGQSTQQRSQIRATNIHPTIRAAMMAYVQKFRSIRLLQMLSSLNLTLDDLPNIPPTDGSTAAMCYNFVLGKCVHDGCQHRHVPAADVPDDFATKMVEILAPAIANFMTNGAPQRPRRNNNNNKRRRTE